MSWSCLKTDRESQVRGGAGYNEKERMTRGDPEQVRRVEWSAWCWVAVLFSEKEGTS